MRDNMDDLKDKNVLNANGRPLRTQDVPGAASRQHAERLLEEGRDGGANPANQDNKYSLNDDRRVKVLSPARWWPSGSSATGWPLWDCLFW